MARGQNQFKKDCLEDKLIDIMPYVGSGEELLMLTKKDRRHARCLDPERQKMVTDPSRIAAALIPHNLAVQQAIIAFHDRSKEFIVEPQLDIDQQAIRPDALIGFMGLATALEMERTPKHKLRVYYTWLHHIRLLMDKRYEHVLYCFSDPTTFNFYRNLFNEPYWPVVIFHRRAQRYRIKENDDGEWLQFDPADYRKKFSFRMIEGTV